MKKRWLFIMLWGLILMFGLFGCGGKRYQVDYCGEKEFFHGAKDSYRAGEKVRLTYTLVATDTDYAFYVDGERVGFGYSDKEGFIIEFTMPEHDIQVWSESWNTMIDPEPFVEEEA